MSPASGALRQLLHPQDAVLGPWVPGRDLLEDELVAFSGAPGGPASHPWQAGLLAGSGAGADTSPGESRAEVTGQAG